MWMVNFTLKFIYDLALILLVNLFVLLRPRAWFYKNLALPLYIGRFLPSVDLVRHLSY
jgi:hypothetical protein